MNWNYVPNNANEKQIYENLWKTANPEGGMLTGAKAVTLFQSSGIDTAILKKIWEISCPNMNMDVNQFYSALRYISIVQRKLSQGAQVNDVLMTLSKEQLMASIHEDFAPPKFNLQLEAQQNFFITAEEHVKYHQLFLQYDSDHDGLLTAQEASGLFDKSGMSPDSLRLVFTLADQDGDNKLNPKEFCIGFHIIICVMKRKYPLPTVLPAVLRSFLDQAPLVPPGFPSISTSPVVVAANLKSAVLEPVNATGKPVDVLTSTVIKSSYTTSSSVDVKSKPSSKNDIHRPVVPSEPVELAVSESDMNGVMSTLKATVNFATDFTDSTVETVKKANSLLSKTLQKLKEESISMKASVESAKTFNSETTKHLNDVISEISTATNTLSLLQTELNTLQTQNLNIQTTLGERSVEKQLLIQRIDDMRRQIELTSQEMYIANEKALALAVEKTHINKHSQGLAVSIEDKRNVIQQVNRDVDQLTSILSALTQDRLSMKKRLSQLQFDIGESQLAVVKEKALVRSQEEELAALRDTESELKLQVEHLLQRINEIYTTPLVDSRATTSAVSVRVVDLENILVDEVSVTNSKSNASSESNGTNKSSSQLEIVGQSIIASSLVSSTVNNSNAVNETVVEENETSNQEGIEQGYMSIEDTSVSELVEATTDAKGSNATDLTDGSAVDVLVSDSFGDNVQEATIVNENDQFSSPGAINGFESFSDNTVFEATAVTFDSFDANAFSAFSDSPATTNPFEAFSFSDSSTSEFPADDVITNTASFSFSSEQSQPIDNAFASNVSVFDDFAIQDAFANSEGFVASSEAPVNKTDVSGFDFDFNSFNSESQPAATTDTVSSFDAW